MRGGGDVRNLGMPVSLAQRYYEEGADEVTFLNITGFRDCPLTDLPMLKVLTLTLTLTLALSLNPCPCSRCCSTWP